ncbi:GNAT family N-acetyltransferase [Tenggerimyces flavus]|uniref:GNAT family N-acetyltransferase n=1 Tax=Tenggerimyces flavus TaxID=1708749 RepID=A0ABV7Y898_9ACTN|nr:GNAT family protein [Tenggerimyces flavus]MBM7785487.1 RimJ/RimL family protein N-acetyltransferase [Tenggerimyces flavus]
MLADYLPTYRLRLRTERLELRLPDFDDFAALADVAAAGIHGPGVRPYLTSWAQDPPVERGRTAILWNLRLLAQCSPEKWNLPFVTVLDGAVIGKQEIVATDFKVTREAATGSWLGIAHHGKGLGTEMRAAALELMFTGLGAEYALSDSLDGNPPSEGVSRKLGYRPDGIEHQVANGERLLSRRWRLSREDWLAHRRYEVAIEGLDDDVRAMLGAEEHGRAG